MAESNYVKNIAIVGAGGNIGTFISNSLVATGKHVVTAITRKDSSSKIPSGVQCAYVDYDDHSSIVNALKGQHVLIITMSFWAPKDLEQCLIRAAADAGVPWIIPNDWASDSEHEGLTQGISSMSGLPGIRNFIQSLGKSSFMAIANGAWYEWCLAEPSIFGIDTVNKQAVLYDRGETKVSTSTWPQIGRAVAALLSLPINSESEHDKDKCLDHFRNKIVYIDSFTVSQREMLESIYRVTGTTEAQWNLTQVDARERFEAAFQAREKGDFKLGRQIYTRLFFDDNAGNYKERKGLANTILNLPVEEIDEATKIAIDWQKNGGPMKRHFS